MDRYFETRVLPLGTNTFGKLPTGHPAGSTQMFESLIYFTCVYNNHLQIHSITPLPNESII